MQTHPYVLYVTMPGGRDAFFSWGTYDRALAVACAKKQLDLVPDVKITGFCLHGVEDVPGIKELIEYLAAKNKKG